MILGKKVLVVFRKILINSVLIIFFLGCNNPSKEEIEVIKYLNIVYYEKYFFSASSDIYGINLKIKLKEHVIDSIGLKEAFDSSIVKYKNVKNITWSYLDVYSKEGTYLFTISKVANSEHYNFFKSGED